MQEKIKVLIFMLSVVVMTGCGTYRLVEVDVNTELQVEAEITAVKHIELRLAKSRNVVISYSAEYYDTSEKSADAKVLMGGKGMWITEIEREFVKKGFRVLSRQKYNELIREKGVGAEKEVAGLLGADLIIQINSLEYSDKEDLSVRTEKKYTVYESDSSGKKIKHASRNKENSLVESNAAGLARQNVSTKAYMALLDCKIIDAKTGELIVFYRNQAYRLRTRKSPALLLTYLFELDDEQWNLIDSSRESKSGGSSFARKGLNRSESTQVKIQMVRRVCSDLVNKIRDYRRIGKNQ